MISLAVVSHSVNQGVLQRIRHTATSIGAAELFSFHPPLRIMPATVNSGPYQPCC